MRNAKLGNHLNALESFDFVITRMISDQIALHSVQLPLLICLLVGVEFLVSRSSAHADALRAGHAFLLREEGMHHES